MRIVVALLVAGSVLVGLSAGGPTGLEDSAWPKECDRTRLGIALSLDTSAMIKWQHSGPSPQSTEGQLVDIWSDSAGPRIVQATYLGETGRTVTSFYLLTPRDFVVVTEETIYETPIAIDAHPRVKARVPAVFYFCDGKPDFRGDSVLAASVAGELQTLLSTKSGGGGR